MARIIINSDDFGLNEEINDAIILAFNKNLISTTTSLVNYDDGLIDGKKKLLENNICENRIGIHVNLTTGRPLSYSISKNAKFCNDGYFHSRTRLKPILYLDKQSEFDVLLELESQILRFQEVMGFLPSHIDGHHHIHTEYAIFKILRRLAIKYGIKYVRLSRNVGVRSISCQKYMYKKFFNYLVNKNFETTTFFGSLDDYTGINFHDTCTYEVMVHAKILRSLPGIVFDDDGIELDVKLIRILPQSFTLITYLDL